MSNRINASLNLTKIGEAVRAGHSAVKTDSKGNKYLAVTLWINDSPDQFGNDVGIQLNSTQEKREAEGKVYVGNGKTATLQQAATPASQPATQPATEVPGSGLPF